MGDVIYMTDVAAKAAILPKTTAHNYKSHRIILSFRPDALPNERWQWHVKFTRVYEFAGNAASHDAGLKLARQKIESMIERGERAG